MIKIPPDERPALMNVASLPDPVVSELRKKLIAAAKTKKLRELSGEDVAPVPHLSKEDGERIVDTIISLSRTKAYYEPPLDDFVNDISEAMRSEPKFPAKGDVNDRFRQRMKEFLSIDAITESAKATVLRYEHERTVQSVRILTDIRPVFGSNVEKPPELAVVSHILKVAYHRGEGFVEIFFAFDEDDLQELKKAVLRAELKAKSIRAALASSQLRVVEQ